MAADIALATIAIVAAALWATMTLWPAEWVIEGAAARLAGDDQETEHSWIEFMLGAFVYNALALIVGHDCKLAGLHEGAQALAGIGSVVAGIGWLGFGIGAGAISLEIATHRMGKRNRAEAAEDRSAR